MSEKTATTDLGYLEAAQKLVAPGSRIWTQAELLKAAESATLRNTGWPLGVVIHRDELRPIAAEDGIEARMRTRDLRIHSSPGNVPTWEDYWHFNRDGSYYVARILEEDHMEESWQSSDGHPERALWFDMRIWRIAEAILHSASLYRSLGVPPDEPYVLAVNHAGLKEREFYTSNMRRHVRRGRVCKVASSSWAREVTQDLVQANYRELVEDISSQLFVLFDFADIGREVINDVIDNFEKRRF